MLRHPALIPLSRQHHNGLALDVLVRRALEADSSPSSAAEQARRCLERFDLEIRNHFELEEQLLFPAIEEVLGPHPLVRRLCEEHRSLATALEGLRSAPASENLLEWLALLRAHIRTEENELFEEIQSRLPAECFARLQPLLEERAVQVCLK